MRAAITGATGLLGSNLALLLLEQGVKVRCTYRGSLAATQHLAGFDIEWVRAELSDVPALTAAFADCDVVFHCAAMVSFLRKPSLALIAANVDGTRNIIAAVRAAQVKRLVHVSSVVANAVSTDGTPVDETKPWNLADFGVDEGYSITKRQAEELVTAEVGRGLDAVIVNPCYLLGPYDPKPSRMIVQVVQGKVPGASGGSNNFVDVRDVCRGMIAAWHKGRKGERYILGGYNMSYHEFMQLVAKVAGVKPPQLVLPRFVAAPVGLLGDLKQLITGKEAFINSVTVRYGYLKGYIFSSDKAKRELDYAPGPLEPAIADAIAYARKIKML